MKLEQIPYITHNGPIDLPKMIRFRLHMMFRFKDKLKYVNDLSIDLSTFVEDKLLEYCEDYVENRITFSWEFYDFIICTFADIDEHQLARWYDFIESSYSEDLLECEKMEIGIYKEIMDYIYEEIL